MPARSKAISLASPPLADRHASTTCAACTNSVRRFRRLAGARAEAGVDLGSHDPGQNLQARQQIAPLCEAGAIADRRYCGTRDDWADPRHCHHSRRDQTNIVSKRGQLAAYVMSSRAGFHADQATRNVGKPALKLSAGAFSCKTIAPR